LVNSYVRINKQYFTIAEKIKRFDRRRPMPVGILGYREYHAIMANSEAIRLNPARITSAMPCRKVP